MLIFGKFFLSLIISIITLLSGSGFSSLKMVCLCSGDITISVFDKESCEKPKEIKDIPVVDHKCCDYSETSVKLNPSTINPIDGVSIQNFDFISFPVLFIYHRINSIFLDAVSVKDFISLLQSCPKRIIILHQNFRI
ncbi:MAG: hypothetical protein V4667_01055 [Bacteroidota bacterium]